MFPCGDNLVCIIDDRSDVWNFAPNVVQVMPYHFFQHTGDINAPPGLQKKENDNVAKGFDFSNLGNWSFGINSCSLMSIYMLTPAGSIQGAILLRLGEE